MTTLDEFHQFPKLIPELRIHIWHHALLIPRLVVVWKHEKRGTEYLRRSSKSPLLSVNSEARREALRYYSSPLTGPCILPPLLLPLSPYPFHQEHPPQEATNPHYIGPGTDILYIKGTDPLDRRYKPVSWTCITLSRDLEAAVPSFAPIRRLAVDAGFLRATPLYQFVKMPYSIWKLVVSDLRQLEELFVVIDDGAEAETMGNVGMEVVDGEGSVVGMGRTIGRESEAEWVEERLQEAKEGYREYMECVWADEANREEIERWRLPEVTQVTFGELVERCWTSWE